MIAVILVLVAFGGIECRAFALALFLRLLGFIRQPRCSLLLRHLHRRRHHLLSPYTSLNR
jgi:hypothetical protein